MFIRSHLKFQVLINLLFDRAATFKSLTNPILAVKILFRIAEDYRHELYYGFGLLCLISWFAFNVWILRDYFLPCWLVFKNNLNLLVFAGSILYILRKDS